MQNGLAEIDKNFCVIVFRHDTSLWWLHFLKRGFRHCDLYIYKNNDKNDYSFSKLSSYSNFVDFQTLASLSPAELIAHERSKGHICLLATFPQNPPLKTAPFLPFTCVELVKRVLAIHSWTILTPWQLHQHIKEQNVKIT